MDYAHYVSRRPPSPPLRSKLRSFSITPSIASSTHIQQPLHPSHPQHFPSIPSPTPLPQSQLSPASTPNRNHVTSQPEQLQSTNSSSLTTASITTSPSNTSPLSSVLHRRALFEEYTTLAATVKAATDAVLQTDRQELIRFRLEHMLSFADSRSRRILTLALQKCDATLDTLASTTVPSDEARARMRVIESKYFHGCTASAVPSQLRSLHIKRGTLATLVDQIMCTLHDQVRIHFLLTQLASNLSNLQSLLASLSHDRSNPATERRDRDDDTTTTVSPSVPNPTTRNRPSFSNSYSSHRMDTVDRRQSSANRSSFSSQTTRQKSFSRRMSFSYSARHFSQDGVLPPDRPVSPAPMLGSTFLHSRSKPSSIVGNTNTRRYVPQRQDSPNIIHQVVKRALSYNSTQNGTSSTPGDETCWWGDTPPPSALVSSTAPSVTCVESKLGRLSFGGVHNRPRMASRTKSTSSSKGATPLARAVDALPWRRRNAYLVEDTESVEDDAVTLSPISHSTVSDCQSSRLSTRPGFRRNPQSQVEQSILVDIDSLCTEACSMLSSTDGVDGEKLRPRGRSSALWGSNGGGEIAVKPVGRLGFGRLRVHGQMKKLWAEINELYAIVVTHGPHLVAENIVPRLSVESGLLGSWNAGKGQGNDARVSFQTGVVMEAVRKVENVVAWQRRLVVAIRRDLYEQRKTLRQLDHVISQAYVSSMENEKG